MNQTLAAELRKIAEEVRSDRLAEIADELDRAAAIPNDPVPWAKISRDSDIPPWRTHGAHGYAPRPWFARTRWALRRVFPHLVWTDHLR
jgi:hypothetical protein